MVQVRQAQVMAVAARKAYCAARKAAREAQAAEDVRWNEGAVSLAGAAESEELPHNEAAAREHLDTGLICTDEWEQCGSVWSEFLELSRSDVWTHR